MRNGRRCVRAHESMCGCAQLPMLIGTLHSAMTQLRCAMISSSWITTPEARQFLMAPRDGSDPKVNGPLRYVCQRFATKRRRSSYALFHIWVNGSARAVYKCVFSTFEKKRIIKNRTKQRIYRMGFLYAHYIVTTDH